MNETPVRNDIEHSMRQSVYCAYFPVSWLSHFCRGHDLHPIDTFIHILRMTRNRRNFATITI